MLTCAVKTEKSDHGKCREERGAAETPALPNGVQNGSVALESRRQCRLQLLEVALRSA